MRVILRCAFIAVLVSSAIVTASERGQDRVYYLYQENIHTPEEVREHLHYIGISNKVVSYALEERVYGCLKKSTTRTMFQHYAKVSESEQAQILEDLASIGVFEIKADAQPIDRSNFKMYGHLDAEYKGRSNYIGPFFTPPLEGDRKRVHDYLFSLAERMSLTRPRPDEDATDTIEGDMNPATEVEISELVKHIERYNGKRVLVIGYQHAEMEMSNFGPKRYRNMSRAFSKSLWLGDPSAFAARASIDMQNDAWLRVEATVDARCHGHMSCWPGELVRVTKATVLSTGKRKPHA